MKKTILLLLLISPFGIHKGFAQFTDKEQAELMAKQALIFEDKGNIMGALELLHKAEKLDSTNIMYSYEKAFAYNLLKDYKMVKDILEKLVKREDANGKIYQLLGNTYDNLKDSARSVATYQEGLKRFPNAGELYLEMGNYYVRNKQYKAAVTQYESGIKADPMFASNYYWAAKMFLGSNEKVWGLIYGEMFMLLESGSRRTAEISRMLYLTCKNQISTNPDGTYNVQLATSTIPDSVANRDPLNKKLPFSKSVYEPLLALGLQGEKILDINSLSKARKTFTEYYYNTDIFQNYPNALMDYQYKLLKAGHIDSYNHWVLAEGNHEDFVKWQNANKLRYNKFMKWFTSNPLKLDDKYKFYREQY